MNKSLHDEFVAVCRRRHWKCTEPRWIVYEFVRGNRSHPTVDAVWFHVRAVRSSTTRESIYRILNEFSEAGILNRLDHIMLARYDSETRPHGHFICRECGNIIDFPLPKRTGVPKELDNGTLRGMEIRVSGICPECLAKVRQGIQDGSEVVG